MSDRYRILITTDSTCDLPGELAQNLPIAVIPCYILTENGRFVDGKEMASKDLLQYIRGREHAAHVEVPSISEYKSFFEEKLMLAEGIIHISMGRGESPGYERACEAARDMNGVFVHDSGQISSGAAIVACHAALLVQEGRGYEEICEEVARFSKRVSSGLLVHDLEYMGSDSRISKIKLAICESMLLYPMFEMRKSKIHATHIFSGRWENVMCSFIKRKLKYSWRVNPEILVITHVGLDAASIERIKEEVKKYVQFEHIVIKEAGPAATCTCGEGAFGLFFVKKTRAKQDNRTGLTSRRERFTEWRKTLTELIANEEFPIRQRILNLILSAALVGSFFSAVITLLFGAYESAVSVFVVVGVLAFALYLSVIRKKWKEAGLLICFVTNTLIFPVMFFLSGGTHSGMPVWFVLGLLFDWLILTGWICYVVFGINLAVMIGCIIFGEIYPQYVTEVSSDYMRNDIIQSMIIVVLILGLIYKYQAYAYEKQKKQIEEHEKELLRSNSAKDLFLANMSHEIRTPINGIMGMNTMLLRECGENTSLQEYGRNIQSSSQTLLSLVNDILDVSKIEAGKFEIIPVEYDIFSVVNDCYQIAHSRCMAKGLEFELDFNPAIPSRLYGDEVRIRQVINNLLSNAVKYTERGTVRLSVDMERRGDAMVDLLIRMHDTGIGIREEDRVKIFESFSRVDEKRNRNVEGTGLGLSLTKNLVELMHGTIRVDSIYGQGSTFTVRFPQQIRDRRPAGDFAKKYQAHLAEQTDETEVIRTTGAVVLVVDDVPMNLLVAKGLLQYTGAKVDTADSGKEALSLAGQKKYDLIFMDHLMPEMDGIACLHQMQNMKNNKNQDTPVIALTANALSGIREEYIKAGFHDYLSKPIREPELFDILRKYLPEEKIAENVENEITEDAIDDDAENAEDDKMTNDKNDNAGDSGFSMERLRKVPGLDTECGMKYCMQKEEFYFMVIEEYLKSDKEAILNAALADEDWEEYRVNVHALKSTSLNIGAKELSGEAKLSETACKEGDYDTVRSRHQALMEQYRELVQALESNETDIS